MHITVWIIAVFAGTKPLKVTPILAWERFAYTFEYVLRVSSADPAMELGGFKAPVEGIKRLLSNKFLLASS